MDTMEDKLNSILSNPALMAQITTMAQSLGNQSGKPSQESNEANVQQSGSFDTMPDFDPVMLQKISSIIRGSGVDNNQQVLLKALKPYLSEERIIKLEKAMRAAKLAGFATSILGKSGLSFLTGR